MCTTVINTWRSTSGLVFFMPWTFCWWWLLCNGNWTGHDLESAVVYGRDPCASEDRMGGWTRRTAAGNDVYNRWRRLRRNFRLVSAEGVWHLPLMAQVCRLVCSQTLDVFMATELHDVIFGKVGFEERADAGFPYWMVWQLFGTSLETSGIGCSRQELSKLVFTKRATLVPDLIIFFTLGVDCHEKWTVGFLHLLRPVLSERFEELHWTFCVDSCKDLGQNGLLWPVSVYPCRVLLPLSVFHTSISRSVSGSFWTTTSPQHNFLDSSLARKPKCKENNNHSALWSAKGSWCPNCPDSKSLFCSSMDSSLAAFGLFPNPLCTRLFLLAARTWRERKNSSPLKRSKGNFYR